jgi:hypothetical protein
LGKTLGNLALNADKPTKSGIMILGSGVRFPLPLPIKSAISKITANINIRRTTVDLLLQNPETKRRYEVEIQLGATDEAHIIRTIEYWDIEKKL